MTKTAIHTEPSKPPLLMWEAVRAPLSGAGHGPPLLRAKCPGGWIVRDPQSGGIAYVPDVDGQWGPPT